MTDYIKLEQAPQLVLQSPTCSACGVDVESEDGGWLCPVCGTTWSYNDSDGDDGSLYEEWSGETLESEPASSSAALDAGIAHERAKRAELYRSLGWCEHGHSGDCWVRGCSGGTKR